jgi:glycosyltransferase involved in cell wall biosynthesis
MIQLMRIAWFSPLPPIRSGIATVNADLLARLNDELAIDCFVDGLGRTPAGTRTFDAHDFVWKHRKDPYDLITYQLGNAACHDYVWAYLARFPGLVVLHDPRLHQARARQLLNGQRFDDYRREFWYNHPDAQRDFVEYAVAGLGGPIYYCWPMLRVVMRTARLVAVHNVRVAADLRDEFPGARVEAIHLGHPAAAAAPDPAARARLRAALGVADTAIVFAAVGKVTAEKRVGAMLRALGALVREQADVHLVLAGDSSGYPALDAEIASHGIAGRVHVAGYVDHARMLDYVAAADACLCLRWPTALETSASWLHGLAASRPTVISDLAHLVDVPRAAALRVDLLDEDRSLLAAMRALASDSQLRETLGRDGLAYWQAHHTLDRMADDYRRLIPLAAASPAPLPVDLPAHFTDDHSGTARAIAARFGLSVDQILGA